jgi:hypothetical protein
MPRTVDKPNAWTAFAEERRQSLGTAGELIAEAEREERIADQYRGCSFHGEWPGSGHLRRASLLRRAAAEIAAAKRKPK